MVFGTSQYYSWIYPCFSLLYPQFIAVKLLRTRRPFAFSSSFTLVTTCLYFEHRNLSGSGKSPAFKPYPDILSFVVVELLVPRTFFPCPLENIFQRDKRSIGILLPLLHRSFSIFRFIRWEIKLFMGGIMKALLFSFSIANSDNFISSLAIFDPLFGGSFRAYVTKSFNFKENIFSCHCWKNFENIISINPESSKTVKKRSLKEVILWLFLT